MTERAIPLEDSTLAETPTPIPAPAAAPDHSRRNSLVINLMLVATFVVFLNETIMGVALPHLMADLDITALTPDSLTTKIEEAARP